VIFPWRRAAAWKAVLDRASSTRTSVAAPSAMHDAAQGRRHYVVL